MSNCQNWKSSIFTGRPSTDEELLMGSVRQSRVNSPSGLSERAASEHHIQRDLNLIFFPALWTCLRPQKPARISFSSICIYSLDLIKHVPSWFWLIGDTEMESLTNTLDKNSWGCFCICQCRAKLYMICRENRCCQCRCHCTWTQFIFSKIHCYSIFLWCHYDKGSETG